MFRKVRKKKNELELEVAKKVLKKGKRGVLAVNGDNGYPYAIPINYLYDEEKGKIFFHSSRSGHKVDSIKISDKICFTVCGEEQIKEEDWAPYVKSVVVFGRCHFIEESNLSMDVLKKFAMKYYPNEEMVIEQIAMTGRAVQMFEISIEHISGKEVQEK